MKYLVTGGAGFIGSAVVRKLIMKTDHEVCVVDKLTYAGHLSSLAQIDESPRYRFEKADICDFEKMGAIINAVQPDVIMHLAAESHVDRSIDGPAQFISTNVVGTYNLLEQARRYWHQLPASRQETFRFQHISTDEVYGSLGQTGLFTEETSYAPNSPYSASKASSDHLVRAWRETFGMPTLVTNCSNNYGPYHFPEKLIPLIILNGLEGKPLPVYGKGDQVRDWLYVEDHADALVLVSEMAAPGTTYNVGGNEERQNIQVIQAVCDILDDVEPAADPRRSLITHVEDRPGHDYRYAIDASKISSDLGWAPTVTFTEGLEKTVRWFIDNRAWWEPIRRSVYDGQRLGHG